MTTKQNQLKIHGYIIPIKVSHVLREKSSKIIEAYDKGYNFDKSLIRKT